AVEFTPVARPLSRLGQAFLVALAIIFLTARPAGAQAPPTPNYVWNVFGGGFWSVGNNWVPGGPPPSSVDQVLGFGSSPLQTANGYTSTFNLGPFDLNSLVFNSSASSGTSLTLTGAAAGDTLRFDTSSTGTLPSIWQVGSGRVTIQ